MVKDNYTGDITQGKARGGPGAMEVVVGVDKSSRDSYNKLS